MPSDYPQLRKPKGFDAATAAVSKKYRVLLGVMAVLCLAAVYQASKPVLPQPAKGNNGARIATTTSSTGSGAPVASKTTSTLRSTKAVASSRASSLLIWVPIAAIPIGA
jgi:hypothetical protein